jgi:undecaprenyl-diphosphatase
MVVLLRTLLWQLHHWDAALSYALALPPGRARRHAAHLLAHLGDSLLWFPLVGALWLRARQRSSGHAAVLARVLAGMAAAGALVALLKAWVRRPRPGPASRLLVGADKHSFPSGHAARMVVAAHGMAALHPLGGWAGALLVLAVGGSRIRLGIHYVGDVLAGVLLGTLVARASSRLPRWRAGSRAPLRERPVR